MTSPGTFLVGLTRPDRIPLRNHGSLRQGDCHSMECAGFGRGDLQAVGPLEDCHRAHEKFSGASFDRPLPPVAARRAGAAVCHYSPSTLPAATAVPRLTMKAFCGSSTTRGRMPEMVTHKRSTRMRSSGERLERHPRPLPDVYGATELQTSGRRGDKRMAALPKRRARRSGLRPSRAWNGRAGQELRVGADARESDRALCRPSCFG